ncbi:MAG: hypothetical protein ACXWWG_00610 [Nitrospira sp.]
MNSHAAPTLVELTTRYNALAPALGKPIRRSFSDKKSAEQAIEKLLAEVSQLREETAGRKDYNYPTGSVKPIPKENTLRGRCFRMLLKGATFAEVMAMVSQFQPQQLKGVPYRTDLRYRTFRLITSMHHGLGYGLVKDEDTGIIKIEHPHGLVVPENMGH